MRSLAARMVLLAILQLAVLAVAGIVIWYFTAPERPPHFPHPEPLHHHHQHNVGPLLTLIVGVVVLLVGSVLIARWLVRPIQQLSETARALGAGDLAARSGLNRSDELGQLARRMDEMGARIERMVATERELLANVAHELRTPLSRISVALDLAGEGNAERARTSLGEIAVDVAELEVIVDDILTALRYDVTRGAGLPLRRTHTSPDAIANASAERMRARHPDRPLELAIAPGLREIDVDPVMFRRVIDNLLENSHKYTPERVAPILLAVRGVRDAIEFEIVDRGIGIATGDLPNIYNTFFRGEPSRSRETGGVGLGLTLAKRIVEAHGGTIEITSSVGTGTRARVSVPAIAHSE
jgi:signal transduction histidine kinase